MKNKIIFAVIFIFVVSAGIVSIVFLTQKGSLIATNLAALESSPTPEPQPAQNPATPTPEPKKEITRTVVDTDYFTLALPLGWEMSSEEDTLPIIAVDSDEEVINKKAKEINFRTNLSINTEDLGENSFEEYIEGLKAGLISTIPLMEITKEEETVIGDKEAYLMEISSIQGELEFGTFVALVMGKNNTVWAFSFNTLKESWPRYKDIFYRIIGELKMI